MFGYSDRQGDDVQTDNKVNDGVTDLMNDV